MRGTVIATCRSGIHGFSKEPSPSIRLLAGLGVDGDAHAGAAVRHRSRVRRDPSQPNLRQVHLIHAELLDEVARKGFRVAPGELGENILTQGLDLLGLPRATRLRIGESAVVEVTGLRNPCHQIDDFRQGLLAAVIDRAADGALVRKAGIMSVVVTGGEIRPGDSITAELPAPPHIKLDWV